MGQLLMNTYGALKPKIDKRDYKIAAAAIELPKVYTCPHIPAVKNQGGVCSCVAHATSSILESFYEKEHGEKKTLSTDFIYGMQGVEFGRLEGGMYLRDACKIVKKYGDPSRETIKGNTEQPECTEKLKQCLNEKVYKEAEKAIIKSYASCISSPNTIKQALINHGPVLASVKWYDNFWFDGKVIQMDKSKSYGYHAIMIYGYNEVGWICQNSWGKNFCGDGHFVYPYEEELEEAWSLVDSIDAKDIKKPKLSGLLDIFYKIYNLILNYIQGRV